MFWWVGALLMLGLALVLGGAVGNGIKLNPHKDASLTLAAGDSIVVIAS